LNGEIALDGVTLWRRTQEEYGYDLKRTLFALLRGRIQKVRRRRVLHGVTFEVKQGEKVGIIGPNGSGKSTLLKVICGILEASDGAVRASGQVAPLLELGAGFDTEISVADNIVLYGTLLGRSRADMVAKIDEILAFAELEEYRDVPVRALSSGMVARLGFAIATDIEPDILILDEVLSVGDEVFRKKSRRRIEELWKGHVTVLIVSHELQFVRESCDRAVWLQAGEVQMDGPAASVVDAYLGRIEESAVQKLARARARLSQEA
jgi:ABC-type polysaccharide/polyol phosphate transport system ATPase subunit